MTNAEKVQLLLTSLERIEQACGIRRDFVPLGTAIDVATIIRDAREAISDKRPILTD